jgi:hypothetical protein
MDTHAPKQGRKSLNIFAQRSVTIGDEPLDESDEMNTRIARSSVWRLALLVLIAGIGMVRIWGATWRLHPDEPWSVSLIYRARGGYPA